MCKVVRVELGIILNIHLGEKHDEESAMRIAESIAHDMVYDDYTATSVFDREEYPGVETVNVAARAIEVEEE